MSVCLYVSVKYDHMNLSSHSHSRDMIILSCCHTPVSADPCLNAGELCAVNLLLYPSRYWVK